MLTQDEIKKVRDSAKIITFEDAQEGKIKIVEPVPLSNGYQAGMTVNVLIPPNPPVEHLSVSNTDGITDPAEAEHIALEILGKGYLSLGPINLKNVLHFVKPLEKETKQ